MLAYELYRKNKSSPAIIPPDRELPIKKMFCIDGKVSLDGRLCEEYNSRIVEASRSIQERLQMPLNTIDEEALNLPDHRTSKFEPNPYVMFYGQAKARKIEIVIGKKKDRNGGEGCHRTYSLDLESGERSDRSNGEVKLRLDKKNYMIGEDTMFAKYVDSGLIGDDGVLNAAVCDAAAHSFLGAARGLEPDRQIVAFRVFILPDRGKIRYANDAEVDGEEFVDYFGNLANGYSSSATKNTKFLTYDDRIYTPNCKQGADFYRSVGIGAASLGKVYVDRSATASIAGMAWTFIDMADNKSRSHNEAARRGLVSWLRANYGRLKASTDDETRATAMMKVLCVKQKRSQQELLVDENLTMKRMGEMFDGVPDDMPAKCLEVLIDNTGKRVIWSTYMNAAKSFIAGRRVPKEHLLAFFGRFLARKGVAWRTDARNRAEVEEFFRQSSFCMMILNKGGPCGDRIDRGEAFAEGVGKIARLYVKFKKDERSDNSLTDMLTYSKYDRERLRFVVARVSRGVHLSNADDIKKDGLTAKIGAVDLGEEIPDADSSKDYSYFFFRGYYWGERAE